MTRREAIGTLAALAALPALAGFRIAPAELEEAALAVERALAEEASTGVAYAPKFFTAREWETVRVLADLVIPRDERSGSATDAGVPEFMDFILTEYPDQQTPMRGGLAWLDAESGRRFGKTFVLASASERTALLDDIAWPAKARPEMSQGVAFFSRFRNLTSSGFWSSRMGVQDIRYLGNTGLAEWNGCPPEALRRLGVSYGAGE